jgi:enoyl-CoA hydratase/carnithine racemase
VSHEPEILVERAGAVCHIWLNRPDVRNALTSKMEADLDEILTEIEIDEQIRVVTLRGKGSVFSSGHDLKEAAADYARGISPSAKPGRVPSLLRLWYFKKPIVAAVHGFVGPWPFIMLGHVDFILAAEGTRFSLEHARLGAEPPGGSPLVFHFPPNVWKKLSMMGGWLDADQAHHYGFVQRVVKADRLDDELEAWTDYIARIPPKQIESTKMAIHRQYELMGLATMELVQSRILEGGHGTPEDMAWFQNLAAKGMKESLRERDAGFDDGVAQV